ncbi:MAG: hypothetical protein AAF389_11430 [Gemmatimonadota bacterium]
MTERVETPTVFADGVVSSNQRDYDITFSADGSEAFFTRRGRRGPPQLYTTRFEGGEWSEPAPAAFTGEGDEGAFVAPDGSLLFSSDRMEPDQFDRSDNVWVTRRDAEGWSEPVPLGGEVNQPFTEVDDMELGAEMGPSLTPEGSLLYATRSDPNWGWDIYVAEPDETGVFLDRRPLRLNTYGDETNPTMSPDGRFLIYQQYGDVRGHGAQDLFAAERTEYGWSDPWPLPLPVNSHANDGWPSFSPDGSLFFWASDRDGGGGAYDVYYVSTDLLDLEGR